MDTHYTASSIDGTSKELAVPACRAKVTATQELKSSSRWYSCILGQSHGLRHHQGNIAEWHGVSITQAMTKKVYGCWRAGAIHTSQLQRLVRHHGEVVGVEKWWICPVSFTWLGSRLTCFLMPVRKIGHLCAFSSSLELLYPCLGCPRPKKDLNKYPCARTPGIAHTDWPEFQCCDYCGFAAVELWSLEGHICNKGSVRDEQKL